MPTKQDPRQHPYHLTQTAFLHRVDMEVDRILAGLPDGWQSGLFSVVIFGGREFQNYRFMVEVMKVITNKIRIKEVIHGGALGADRLGGYWAAKHGILVRTLHAQWKKFPEAAGPMRNGDMVEALLKQSWALAIGFPGGNGTADMVIKCNQAEVPVLDLQVLLDPPTPLPDPS